MAAKKTKGTEDVLLILCKSVQNVLSFATKSDISFSPIVQKTTKTCLKPDIGCFVLFEGGFSGLVVMNFSANSALEIYRNYLINMGMPEEELTANHTSDEVANSLGELMNQIVGNFQSELKNELLVSVNQSQPKMIVLNQELLVAINAKIENPQYRRVSFETADNNPFYLELAMEKTEFVELFPVKKVAAANLDTIIEEEKAKNSGTTKPDTEMADDDFMKELGL